MNNVAKRWGNEREGVINIRKHLSDFLELKKASVSKKSFQTYQSKIRIFANGPNVTALISCMCRESRLGTFRISFVLSLR